MVFPSPGQTIWLKGVVVWEGIFLSQLAQEIDIIIAPRVFLLI